MKGAAAELTAEGTHCLQVQTRGRGRLPLPTARLSGTTCPLAPPGPQGTPTPRTTNLRPKVKAAEPTPTPTSTGEAAGGQAEPALCKQPLGTVPTPGAARRGRARAASSPALPAGAQVPSWNVPGAASPARKPRSQAAGR